MAAAVEINLDPTFADIDRSVRDIMAPPGWKYWLWVGFLATLTGIGIWLWTRQVYEGLQVTSLGNASMWAVYITNFVFWVGIAHAGTLISAILYLFRTRWRTAVFRASETMTIFAIATAGLFPLIHLGRPWFFYFMFPYPNERYLQPDFRSPLVLDVFAIGTYFTISTLFWGSGLVPDCAHTRDRSTGWRHYLYSIWAMGWQGTDRQWRNFSMAYLLLAGLATPLVLSVHSVVSWDFALAQLPGWHDTLFAPYFVAGAIFSGMAMVVTLMIPMRWIMSMEDLITPWHLDQMAKIILLTSLVITYSYICESFNVWYSKDPMEMLTFHMRYFGPWGWIFWLVAFCNCLVPLTLFSPRFRTSAIPLFIVSIFVNIGMWYERFMIIAGSLATSTEPSTWRFWHPSWTECTITVASFAWFIMLFSLFARFMPVMSMTELKEGLPFLKQALRQGYAKKS